MNRNSESHFAQVPHADIQRSKFLRPSDHKTTFNVGDLIPLYEDEVLPGDTHQMDMSALVRMSTPIFPVMDNCFMDFYFFFVPNRLLWDHWKNFMGENTETAWEPETEYTVPQTTAPAGGWAKGTIADYMGIPTKTANLSVSSLPFRAYCLIWNEWFRDQNLLDPCMVSKDDANTAGANDGDYVANAEKGGLPLKAAKYHDYFTSALPSPQKGPDVTIPITGNAPVILTDLAGNTLPNANTFDDAHSVTRLYNQNINGKTNAAGGTSSSFGNATYFKADMSNIQAATINQLRQAFQIQKLYEKDARGGTRYREVLRSHFNVTSPDARQQVPEYLGGYRLPINITQVVQQSETTSTSPQGNTAAFSVTSMNRSMFTKSFTEHGWILGLGVVRTEHTYQQGLERMWSRKSRFDFYWPVLANIGEQAILNKEIYAQGTSADDEAFGYQEAWADYRYKPSRVSGLFRSNATGTLDSWHYADYYTSQPKLGKDWIQETKDNLNRTIAVQDEDQFIGDFYFKSSTTRPMPVYSVPGLIDHH
nr:MAG TPA: major capsid protein [Microviridae sp.]